MVKFNMGCKLTALLFQQYFEKKNLQTKVAKFKRLLLLFKTNLKFDTSLYYIISLPRCIETGCILNAITCCPVTRK